MCSGVGIGWQHRDVRQVVQVIENTHLAKFCHTRQKGELDVGVTRLQHSVKSLQCIAILVLKLIVAYDLQQGLIILINQNDHLHICLLMSQLHNMQEAFLQITVGVRTAIALFPLFQMSVQNLVQILLRLVFLDVQV